MEFRRVRAEETSVPAPNRKGDAPVNTFSNADKFARPSDRTVVAPNVDTLYSISHLDLGKGPIVLEHPNMAGATDGEERELAARAAAPFRMSLRIYRPTAAVLGGSWKPPPIEPG